MRGVDVKAYAYLLEAGTDRLVDAEEAPEVDVAFQLQAVRLEFDALCGGEGGKGDGAAAGERLQRVLRGRDGGVGAQQRGGFVAAHHVARDTCVVPLASLGQRTGLCGEPAAALPGAVDRECGLAELGVGPDSGCGVLQSLDIDVIDDGHGVGFLRERIDGAAIRRA
ncbi:hypothetical protein GCM10010246_03630 [Streptomyces cuspidosporus]|uniref:Uncharacterized protein n=1 Tax=Streptomyces cuspidosporus TaxID=66882 RepID=A0ABN3FAE0_9ACTN